MKKTVLTAFILGNLAILPPVSSQETEETAVCRATHVGRALDFWTGNYRVISNDEAKTLYGTNVIEATLNGCAIIENWTSAQGGEGKSLFYFDARENTWTQVWVTIDTSKPWGLKVKQLVAVNENGAVRFQSQQKLDGGKSYLDRTTLTPMEDGVLQQLIETSQDGGTTWTTSFDALYVPEND